MSPSCSKSDASDTPTTPGRLADSRSAGLYELATAQHGVVATYQLEKLGWLPHQVARLHRHNGWQQLTSDVLVRLGSADSSARRVCAAVLDAGPGAYLSHESAAAWWGHRGSRVDRPVHVVTTRITARVTQLALVHRVRLMDVHWVTDLAGVPVVRPELAALHLFATLRYERAERIVESMWSQRLLSGDSIGHLLDDEGKRGRNGTAGLRRFLTVRGKDYRPPDSGVESRCQQVLNDAGFRLRRQVNLGAQRHWIGRVDFLVEGTKVVIEVQSELHHSSRIDRVADRERIERLEQDGFQVVEVTDEMVWRHPARVVSRVQAAVRPST